MSILAQFLLRLCFGLAAGMAMTSPRQVSSGYYRNHLFVTLGLATLAALALSQWSPLGMWLAVAAAALSYVGSVCWLYEAKRAGVLLLWLVAGAALSAALVAHTVSPEEHLAPRATSAVAPIFPVALLSRLSVVTSGLVLGTTMAAMLLGHWYLNAPGMELAPLRRLLLAMAVAVGLQTLVSASGLVGVWQAGSVQPSSWIIFIMMRWSFGLVGVMGLVWMAWKTLDIPNTQSATGILYVAVIAAFVGELTALLLSAESPLAL